MKPFLLFVTASLLTGVTVLATPVGLCNTGFTGSCASIVSGAIDGQYSLTANPSTGSPNAFIENGYPGWVANSTDSNWIAPRFDQFNNLTADIGLYVYNLSFTADAGDLVSGRWASDNQATMLLNGIPVSSTATNGFMGWTSFSTTVATTGAQLFTFEVTNEGGPSGLRVEFNQVPEPAGGLLVASGLLAAGLLRRRGRS